MTIGAIIDLFFLVGDAGILGFTIGSWERGVRSRMNFYLAILSGLGTGMYFAFFLQGAGR